MELVQDPDHPRRLKTKCYTESGWSGVSDNSSTDSECTILEASSVASDQDRFDTAYEAFRDLSADCMTLTPGSMQGVSPARMRLESS